MEWQRFYAPAPAHGPHGSIVQRGGQVLWMDNRRVVRGAIVDTARSGGRLRYGIFVPMPQSVVWKQRKLTVLAKKAGPGQAVVSVTFLLGDFPEEFEFPGIFSGGSVPHHFFPLHFSLQDSKQ